MADTTQGDTDDQYLALLVPAVIVFLAGLLVHSFIIGVNVTDWWKGISVTPVDHIVTSLGVSRMGIQCANALYLFVETFFLRNLHSYITLSIIGAVFAFFTSANFWLTSLLSIVLCLKISTLHTRLLLYLRGLIVHRTCYLIIGSIILSTFNFLMYLSMAITIFTKNGTYNTTMYKLSMSCNFINFLFLFIMQFMIPLLFYFISTVLIFISLYQHTKKMKMSSNLSISLEIYYSVISFISITFIYNTLYSIGNFVGVIYYYFSCVFIDWLYIVLNFLPVLHSFYLIYRTTKLRSQMSKVLQNVIDFLF